MRTGRGPGAALIRRCVRPLRLTVPPEPRGPARREDLPVAIGPPTRRRPAGFTGPGRDQDERVAVHLSGGTPGRVVPPHDPRTSGGVGPRPARPRRTESRKGHPMHQQPTRPSTADDSRPPWAGHAPFPQARLDSSVPAAPAAHKSLTPPRAPIDVPSAEDTLRIADRSTCRAGRPTTTPPTTTPSIGTTPRRRHPTAQLVSDLPPTHTTLICVALPGLAISGEHGQLTGRGLEGFYRGGRRLLARCQVRVAGREPLLV